jgi:excisionase family DNA binding protein
MTKEIRSRLTRIESLLATMAATSTKVFDLGEAAAYLHVSKDQVYQLTSGGRITFSKPGGKRIYFRKEDLDAYLLRGRREAREMPEEVSNSRNGSFQAQAEGNGRGASKHAPAA